MAKEFRLPDLGEGITEAQIVKLLVKEGQRIEEDQSLFEVETDKAAVEIPSPFAGVAKKVHVEQGQTVNVGDVMVTFDGTGNGAEKPDAAREPKQPSKSAPATIAPIRDAPVPSKSRRTTAPAAPVVRKLAREMGVDIDEIAGSGPGGRVTREDVEKAIRGDAVSDSSRRSTVPAAAMMTRGPAAAPPGESDTDKWGSIRRAPITQIRKTIAQQMMRSVSSIAHVSHMDEADVTRLDALRREYNAANEGGQRVTMMAVLIRAVCRALRHHPVFNASFDLDNGQIIYKEYINVGIAVDTERGLVVPNIRNADRLEVVQIAGELSRIAEKARKVQFAIDDLRGGTFTITNVGALGGTFSTPIVNYPEVAILGVGKAKEKPVVCDGDIVVRMMMPFSLSFDHGVTDGAQAARFCGELVGYLESPSTFLF